MSAFVPNNAYYDKIKKANQYFLLHKSLKKINIVPIMYIRNVFKLF